MFQSPGPDKAPEFHSFLVWREHADFDQLTDTWSLPFNVTALHDVRLLLSPSEHLYEGQTRYLVVLSTNTSYVLRESSVMPGSEVRSAGLFGTMGAPTQFRLTWKVADNIGTLAVHRADDMASPLLSISDDKPIQVENFSFSSAGHNVATFSVCTTRQRTGTGTGASVLMPGCRSILAHRKPGPWSPISNLVMDWSEMADDRGRLQLWVRAFADVEVMVSERVLPLEQDPVYRVTFGGHFNEDSSCFVGILGNDGRRWVRVPTHALLSWSQFRPLWVSVNPQAGTGTGAEPGMVLGTGDLGVPGNSRALLNWTNPAYVKPRYVTLTTYRSRTVHFLVDCRAPPSQLAPRPLPTNFSLLRRVQRILTTPAVATFVVEHVSLTSNDTLVVVGVFRMEWRKHQEDMKWNPDALNGIDRMELWWPEDALWGDAEPPSIEMSGKEENVDKDMKTASFGRAPLSLWAHGNASWEPSMQMRVPCESPKDSSATTRLCKLNMLVRPAPENCSLQHVVEEHQGWTIQSSNITENECEVSINVSVNEKPTIDTPENITERRAAPAHTNGWLVWTQVFVASMTLVVFLAIYSATFTHNKASKVLHQLSEQLHLPFCLPEVQGSGSDPYTIGYDESEVIIASTMDEDCPDHVHDKIKNSMLVSYNIFKSKYKLQLHCLLICVGLLSLLAVLNVLLLTKG